MSPAEQAAHQMGNIAGRKLCETGQPTPNHLDGKGKPHLEAAWRRGYMSAQADHIARNRAPRKPRPEAVAAALKTGRVNPR